jgi:aminoglycoside phosphotransferase (APT) family kinase protein
MAIPQPRDLEALRARLAAWLAQRLPAGAEPELGAIELPEKSGFSSETLLLGASWREGGARRRRGLVVRMRPSGFPIFPEYDMRLQYRCMEVVGREAGVPVPPLHWLEEDESVLGQPFYLMGRVEGQAPPDNPPFQAQGWLFEAGPREQERLFRASIGLLARIHRLDWEKAGLHFLLRPEHGEPGLPQQLGYWTRYLAWAGAGREHPTLEAGLERLRASAPEGLPIGLDWGDARIGNVLYRSFEPVAVLDWEMATLGPGEVDLGWFLFMNRYLAAAAGVPQLPGFPEREAAVALYEEALGRAVRELDWFEAFAALRYGAVWLRVVQRFADAGLMSPEALFQAERVNPATRMLAEALDLPPPA